MDTKNTKFSEIIFIFLCDLRASLRPLCPFINFNDYFSCGIAALGII